MGYTLKEVLYYQNLLSVYEGIKSGIPDPIPEWEGLASPCIGDQGTYTRVIGTRKTAALAAYGSPSQRMELEGIAAVPVKLAHASGHIYHDAATLTQLRQENNPALQRMGLQTLARRSALAKDRFRNTKIAMRLMALAKGIVYLDSKGQLLADSSGSAYNIDYAIPAGNKGQAGGIFAVSLANTSADFIGYVEALDLYSLEQTNYPLEMAFYSRKIVNRLAQNDAIKNMLRGNPAYQMAFLESTIPNGFLGKEWRPVKNAYWQDAAGTNHTIFDDSMIVFTPRISLEWLELLRGMYPVPTSIGDISPDSAAAASDFELVEGDFTYAELSTDPPGIKQILGFTELPVIKVPGAVFPIVTVF